MQLEDETETTGVVKHLAVRQTHTLECLIIGQSEEKTEHLRRATKERITKDHRSFTSQSQREWQASVAKVIWVYLWVTLSSLIGWQRLSRHLPNAINEYSGASLKMLILS